MWLIFADWINNYLNYHINSTKVAVKWLFEKCKCANPEKNGRDKTVKKFQYSGKLRVGEYVNEWQLILTKKADA